LKSPNIEARRISHERTANDNALELLKEILNRYSAAYDGEVFHIEPLNVNDLNYLLDRLHRAKNEDYI
jgi:hypothetical protein